MYYSSIYEDILKKTPKYPITSIIWNKTQIPDFRTVKWGWQPFIKKLWVLLCHSVIFIAWLCQHLIMGNKEIRFLREQCRNNPYKTEFLILSRHITPFFGFWNIPATHLLRSCAMQNFSFTRFRGTPRPFQICSYTSKNHPESITRFVYSKNKLKFGLCLSPTTSPTPSTILEPSYIINRYAWLISICSS